MARPWRLVDKYVGERQKDETFRAFIQRVGKVEVKNMLSDLAVIPSHDAEPGLFTDWGDVREYTIADIGKGECAGEVVAPSEFSLTAAEGKAFEAQVKLDAGDLAGAMRTAYESMIFSAESVVRTRDREWTGNPASTVEEFKKRFFDTGEFAKHANNTQFAAYLFKAQADVEAKGAAPSADEAHRQVEEAQLFLEAAHSYTVNAAAQAPAIPGG
jgi:sulfite reductase (ferredoxin)